MELTPDITKMFRAKHETKWEVQIHRNSSAPSSPPPPLETRQGRRHRRRHLPKQHMDLLLMEQTQSRDYGFSSLSNGQINDFLVVKFLITNMPPHRRRRQPPLRRMAQNLRQIRHLERSRLPHRTSLQIHRHPRTNHRQGCTRSHRLDNKMAFLMPCKKPPDEPEQQTDWKGTSETPAPHAGEAGVFHVGTRKDDFRKQSGSMKDKNSAARRHPRIPLRSSCREERNGGRPLRPGNCRGNRKRSRATQPRRKTQNRLPELFESHPCGNRPKGGYKAGGKPLNRARQSPCKRAWSFPRLYS